MTICIVSNGHGEDILASELAKQLALEHEVVALPLVGEGTAYDRAGIKKIHSQPLLPSGGFAYLGVKNLSRDVSAGLFAQLKEQKAALKGLRGVKLAVCVGDTYNLFFTSRYLKCKKVFVPTAKSNYIKAHSFLDLLIMRKNALVVFPRDEITAKDLRKRKVRAHYLGNLMMDALHPQGIHFGIDRFIGILPGTRDDAVINLRAILEVVSLLETCNSFLVAMNDDGGGKSLLNDGWVEDQDPPHFAYRVLKKGEKKVYLCRDLFADIIAKAELVIGLSGTGNEQAAGLGKPVVTFVGPGAQFTPYFARKQKKLLGDAVLFVGEGKSPKEIAEAVDRLYSDPELCRRMGQEGRKRMGAPGAARKMAELILAILKGEVVF